MHAFTFRHLLGSRGDLFFDIFELGIVGAVKLCELDFNLYSKCGVF